MQIKLLALDMDGTVMCSDHTTLSAKNCAAIEAAIARGTAVVVATGRTCARIPVQMRAVDGLRYALTSNGAAVTDLSDGRVLYTNPMPKELLRRVFALLDDLPVYAEVYCRGQSHASPADYARLETLPIQPDRRRMMHDSEIPTPDLRAFALDPQNEIEKINFPYVPPACEVAFWERLRAMPDAAPTSSTVQGAEVNNATANKADGLRQLCEHLGITPAQVMAIGDAENDLAMLRFAGVAVAMGNASDEVKALADFITDDNDHDGVARAIEKYLL